jgi:hypothetical protein
MSGEDQTMTVKELRDLFLKVLSDNEHRDITADVVRRAAGVILSGAHTMLIGETVELEDDVQAEAFTMCLESVDSIMKCLHKDIEHFNLKNVSVDMLSPDTEGDPDNIQ